MLNFNGKAVQLALAVIAILCLSVSVASAGTVGPVFTPSFDFDGSGSSDVLMQRNTVPNVGIIQTQLVSGTTSTDRGWPDLNLGGDGAYTTIGAGRFDPTLLTQAQIITRKITGSNTGLVRIVTLAADGTTRTAQSFVGGTDGEWAFIGAGDCNGDQADDLVFHKVAGLNIGLIRIVHMDPNNPIAFLAGGTKHPGFLPVLGGGAARGVALNVPIGIGDADGDGRADVWTLDTSNNNVEVLISAQAPNLSLNGDPFETATNPTVLSDLEYGFRGIGIFNRADARADILLEKESGVDIGVLRIDFTGDGGGPTTSSAFPMLLSSSLGESVVSIGDYDAMNQDDVLTRLSTPVNAANAGTLTVRLMDSDGSAIKAVGSSGTLPEIENFEYDVIDGSAVTN